MDYAFILTDYPSGFLSSFLSKGLKTNQLEVNTDEKTLRPIARLKEPRDLFALPRDKENDCPQQAPRWPIECQVIEERIIHVPYVPAQAEPYYQPTGNELKPHPVGEDAGVVVFNYNPISAVNYEVKAVKLAAESSDSDISSSESRASTPKESNSILTMTENPFEKMLGTKNPFSQMLERLHPRSSSNSNEEEDDDEENDDDEDDEEEDEAEPPSTVMRQKGGADEIEDIWANKSPEYQPATPNYIKSQFGKKINKSYEQQQKEESHFIAPVRYNRKQMARFNTSIKSSSNSTLCSQTEEITNTENLLTHVKSFENRPKFKRIKKETEEIPASKLYEQNVENFEKTFKPPSLQAQIELLTVRLSGGLTPDSQLAKKLENMNRNNTTNYRSDLTNKTETTSNFIPLLPQFSRSAVGGSKILTNCHPSSYDEAGEHLEFESRFESGNLAKAVKITESYYELYLRPDLYTSRSKQWFYFRVRRTKKSMTYRFSIVNLVKSDSLYNEGMRPLMYSCIAADKLREGWRRCGDNIRYYRNDDDGNTNDEDDENASYTLTFNIEFAYDDDTVFFAHSYPYTYSDLQEYLMDIQKHPVKSKFCKLRLLCRSLAGNNVYYLTVTAPTADEEAMRRKKSVVVSARVHPSETPASWMMKGLMDFITGDSIVAKRLRHKFIFKLIPMLNPDGVIVGNTRNSLTGKDLNRQYRTVIRETYPSIWYTKAMIKRLIDECGIAMYCDMHAHSRKHNIFIYGCENRRTPEKKLIEQVFPLMMHKNVADKFSFESCKFKIQRSKEGTGRIVMWMLGITNSYTIEASFGGSSLGSRKGTHFNTTDYEHMGRAFCETLLDYCDENPNKERLRLKIIERLLKEGSSADEPLNIPLSDYSSDEGDTSSSSDNEGKDSFSVSDLEGPCCAPLRAPPTSPENHVSLRRFKIKRMRKVMSELDRIYFQPVFKKKFRSIIRGKKKKTKKSRKEQPVVNNSSESEEESDDSSNELENTAILGCKMKVNFKTISNKPNEESIELNSNARKKVMLSNVPSKQNDDKLRLAEKTSNLVKTQKVARPSGGSEKPKSRATSSRTNTAKNSKVKLEQPLLCPTGSLDMSLLPLGVQKIGTKTNKKPSKKNKQISKKKSSPSGTDVQKEEKATRRKRLKVSRVLRLWLENRKIMIYRQKRKTRPRKCTTIRKKRDGADRTPLDMPTTDPGSDILFSTDDECCIGNRVQETFYGTVPRSRRTLLLQSELQRRYIEEIGDGTTGPQKQMPPELVVTSPTKPHTAQYDKQTTLLQEAPQTAPGKFGLNELSMRSELCARTSSWQNLHSTKFSSTKLRLQNTYYKEQRATNDELQLKLSLKKKIWTGIQPDNLILTLDNTRSLQRSLSPLPIKKDTRKEIKKDKKDENELLLTACSQKLIAWQHSGSTTSNTVLSETKKQQLTVNLILRDVKEAQHNRSNTKINHAKNVQKSVIKTDLTYSDTGKLKLKKNSLTKIAETTQLITRLAKARSRPLILTAKKITKSSMPLNAIQQSTQTAVSKGLLGANKFKTGGIVATAVQSKYISRRKKTVNVISNTLEKSQQRPIDITNLDSTAILPSRNEPAHGLVRKVKSKLKKKKRASSANATGK